MFIYLATPSHTALSAVLLHNLVFLATLSPPYRDMIAEIFEPGLNEVFPDLDNDDDFPDATISLRQTPDGSEFWLVGQQGEIKKVDADDLDNISTVVDISNNGVFYVAYEEARPWFQFVGRTYVNPPKKCCPRFFDEVG